MRDVSCEILVPEWKARSPAPAPFHMLRSEVGSDKPGLLLSCALSCLYHREDQPLAWKTRYCIRNSTGRGRGRGSEKCGQATQQLLANVAGCKVGRARIGCLCGNSRRDSCSPPDLASLQQHPSPSCTCTLPPVRMPPKVNACMASACTFSYAA